jgi:hypothetical protein
MFAANSFKINYVFVNILNFLNSLMMTCCAILKKSNLSIYQFEYFLIDVQKILGDFDVKLFTLFKFQQFLRRF